MSQVLIQCGADVNCQNKSLQTPIYLAAVGGHQDVLKMLISQGGDINARDSQQKTALHRYLLLNSFTIKYLSRTAIGRQSIVTLPLQAFGCDVDVGLETIYTSPSVTDIQPDCFVLFK